MSKHRAVLNIVILFLIAPLVAMDEEDKSIKKIVNIAGIQAMTFLNNNEIIILNTSDRPAKNRKSFLKIIYLSSAAKPIDLHPEGECGSFCHLTSDNSKTKVLCVRPEGKHCKILVCKPEHQKLYSATIKRNVSRPCAMSFGYTPNTLLFENRAMRVITYNYLTGRGEHGDESARVEENISSFLKKKSEVAYCKIFINKKNNIER